MEHSLVKSVRLCCISATSITTKSICVSCALPVLSDIGTLVQLGYAYHELCDFSQALAIYKKVRQNGRSGFVSIYYVVLVRRTLTPCFEFDS